MYKHTLTLSQPNLYTYTHIWILEPYRREETIFGHRALGVDACYSAYTAVRLCVCVCERVCEWLCVWVCMCVWKREWVSVCVWEREKERERKRAREKRKNERGRESRGCERECERKGQRERESESGRESKRQNERERQREREEKGESKNKKQREREWEQETECVSARESCLQYGVATVSRLLEITGHFRKKALQKRWYSAKETYNFKAPTHRSHPIAIDFCVYRPGRVPRTATHCNTSQHTATHCNTQCSATHCNTLQHIATQCVAVCCSVLRCVLQCVAVCCSAWHCIGRVPRSLYTLFRVIQNRYDDTLYTHIHPGCMCVRLDVYVCGWVYACAAGCMCVRINM